MEVRDAKSDDEIRFNNQSVSNSSGELGGGEDTLSLSLFVFF